MKDKQFVITEDLEIYDTLDSWHDCMIVDDDNYLIEYLNDGEDGVSNYGKVIFTADTKKECEDYLFIDKLRLDMLSNLNVPLKFIMTDEEIERFNKYTKKELIKELDKEIIDKLDETVDKVFIDSDKTKEEKWRTVLSLAAEKIKEEKDFTEFNKWYEERLKNMIGFNLSIEEKAKLFDAIERNIFDINMTCTPEEQEISFKVSAHKLLKTDKYNVVKNGEDFDLISKWLINRNNYENR